MQEVKFLSLFGDCLDKNLHSVFEYANITDISADIENRTLDMSVRFSRFTAKRDIAAANSSIKAYMRLNKMNYEYSYDPSLYGEGWLPYLAADLNNSFGAGKAFLDGAEYSADENGIKIRLRKNGKNILHNLGVEEHIIKLVRRLFDKQIGVQIISSVPEGAASEEQELKKMQAIENLKVRPVTAEEKVSAPKKPKEKTYDDLPISLSNAKPVLGSFIKTKPTPIKDVTPEDGSAVIWGDVFAFNARETRDGKKNIITFNLTDYTSSYSAKIFGEKAVCKEILDKVKDGVTVMIRGSVTHDPYMRCYVIDTKAVMLIEKTEKEDTYPEKRVELHLHTNMSAMDGMSSAKSLVERAAKWGHKAIAITDHGVV